MNNKRLGVLNPNELVIATGFTVNLHCDNTNI